MTDGTRVTPANLLTEWARLLIGSLARTGVTHAVISPGSRSTPFTWAALHEPMLTTRVIVDERAAAFHAVGRAKVTGQPALLICTSGSAAANYFPAIVEADRSGTPLVVLTADRPYELQGADAPQTIDQVKLYGAAVRHFFELGLPDAAPGALAGLRRVAAQAALFARGPVPGPIHLNARARRPLEPAAARDDAGRELTARVDRLLAEPAPLAPAPVLTPPAGAIEDLARACARARRGVIVCGPLAPWQAPASDTVAELSRRTGFPVLAESTSQLRFASFDAPHARLDAFDALLRSRSFRARFRPELVLRIGAAPTSSAWRDWTDGAAHGSARGDAGAGAAGDDAGAGDAGAGDERPREYVIAPNGWSDPHSSAAGMLLCTLEPTLRALLEALPAAPANVDADWLAWLAAAERAAEDALVTAISFHEGVAVRAILDRLPRRTLLALGNSLPVREADTFSVPRSHRFSVWSQRGANGIDGLIAGATGAAEAAARPTALLLGDVSALHDIGSLALARECTQPLAIVVLDNGGGRIFEQLPLAASKGAEWRVWLTPPRLDLAAAAKAFGVAYARAADAPALLRALEAALARPGATLLHVEVEGSRTIPAQREYWADVDRRISALP